MIEEDREKIDNIFANATLFEKEILHVLNDDDRIEIMRIMTNYMIRDILKEHINFLYIRNLSDFTLRPIRNILFKEIANEWISYAMDALKLSKADALVVLQAKEKVKLIHALAANYYRHYKLHIFEEIADTFIELVASISRSSDKSVLINAVINSDLIANRTVLGINSFDQLYKKARSAKNLKSLEVSKIQMKITETLKNMSNQSKSKEEKEKLQNVLVKYERQAKESEAKKLENFDASLQRVKTSMVNSLYKEIFNP